MKCSEAILLGEVAYSRNNGGQWVSQDGSCGCALGRAYMAAGGHFTTATAGNICAMWPWLANSDDLYLETISDNFLRVVDGLMTIDELVDYVKACEPDEKCEEISPWQESIRKSRLS